MAYFYDEPSHTFSEYLLVPSYSSAECVPANVSLRTPLCRFRRGERPPLEMNIPLASAIMQSVSDDRLAIALAREGGVSFIYGSQTVEREAEMVRRVKRYKAGFVANDSSSGPDESLADILHLRERTGHTTVAVTHDGSLTGRLLGIVTSRDYRVSRMSLDTKVATFMTPFEKLVWADADSTTLTQANDLIWERKLNMLPLIDKNQRLRYMVFRKDYTDNKENELELTDDNKSYIVGAGINTRDYAERIPALVEAGVDVLVIDSSDGFSIWQKDTIAFVRERYGDKVKIGAGNVVDEAGFNYLAEAGADFIKIGIGGGSLTVPYLTFCNVPVHRAVGTSAALGWPIAAAGTLGYAWAGWNQGGLPEGSAGFVYLPAVGILAAATLLSAPLGVRLSHKLPADKLKKGFGILLLLIALRMAWKIVQS